MKIIKITSCIKCPYGKPNWFGSGIVCHAKIEYNQIIYNADKVPDWCPLEDISEED